MNPGENRTATLIREFGEEALNTLEATDDEKEQIQNTMDSFFQGGVTVSSCSYASSVNLDFALASFRIFRPLLY